MGLGHLPTCSVRGDISTPRRGWHLWRFAALIPSGWRLTPIHKVMGDHASRAATPAGASLPPGFSRLLILDCHSPCLFPMTIPENTFPDVHSRLSFPTVISEELSLCPFPKTFPPDHSMMFIPDGSYSIPTPCAQFFLNKLAEWYLAKWQCVSELRKSIPAKSHKKTWELARLFVMNNGCNYLIIS